jgi:hypothetical protein
MSLVKNRNRKQKNPVSTGFLNEEHEADLTINKISNEKIKK